jgi:hypothetical protein
VRLIAVFVVNGHQEKVFPGCNFTTIAGRVNPGQWHIPVFALHTYDLSRLAVVRDHGTTPLGWQVVHEAHIGKPVQRRLAHGYTGLKLEANSATIGHDASRGKLKFRHLWFSGG